jgi:hypothetical protein
MIKLWTYKGTRGPKEIGIVVKEGGFYYKFCYFYLRYRLPIKNKRRKLKVEIIKIESSIFTYFPSDFCKPRHYLEADQIYFHEIFRLLERLR